MPDGYYPHYPYPTPGHDEPESAGLPAIVRDPLGVLGRRWKLSLVTFTALAALIITGVPFLPLQYEASGSVRLIAKRIPDEYVPTTIIAGIFDQFEAIQARVMTRDSLAEVIQETGIYASERDRMTMNELVARLRGATVFDSMSTGSSYVEPNAVTFKITTTGNDPQAVAAVVNEISSRLIDANIVYRSAQAQITTDFMEREFSRADDELRRHQRELAGFRDEYRGSLPEEQDATIAKLERLETLRRSTILRINEFESQLTRARSQTPGAINSVSEAEALRARLHELRASYTENHPSVMAVQRRLAEAEAAERATRDQPLEYDPAESKAQSARVQEILAGLEVERGKLSDIDAEVTRLEALVARTSKITEEYRALIRKEGILQEAYSDYLRKLKNAELATSLESAQQGAQLIRLETALPPGGPTIPHWQIMALGLIAALGLSIVLAFGMELLNPVVIDEAHLEELTRAPILGSIPDLS